MPGIVGLLTRMPRERAEPALLQMVESLRHETFYTAGTWIDESLGVYVGWVARKNSFSDGMPLHNERGDIVLVFSGEEFPDPGQRSVHDMHRPRTGAASHLVRLYEESPQFPAGLNGRFQGLLIDRTRGTTTLFNDRYGMSRLYYHESKEAFYFGAEAKAILSVCPEVRSIDPRGAGEFIACGCVLEDRTLFERIYALPGGSAWVFRNGSIEKKAIYFDRREWEGQDSLEPEQYYRQIREVFSRNLPRYFEGQEQIAISLTGGLDTRMIMAWHKSPAGSLPCYTFGGAFRECRDIVVARQVARASNQPHQVIAVGEEFFSRFAHYAERAVYLTDGCVDVGRSPDLFLNEQARGIAPVRMTGNYGGEVLRRIRAFKAVPPMPGLFSSELVSFANQATETYTALLQLHPVSFAVFKQAPWHHYGILALEETQLSMRSPYLDNDLVQTVFRAPQSALTNSAMCLRLIADGDPLLRRVETDRGPADGAGYLSAALSRGLLEFLFKAEYAYDLGMPQWLAQADHLLSPLHLERLFLGRHKPYQFRVWYRDLLSAYVREMLLDRRTLARPYLNRKQVEVLVQGHLKGNRNYTGEIHALLTLELLHRLLVDR